MSEIAENIRAVKERIAAAALEAGREPSEVRLLAVSKTKPLEMIRAAMAAGQTAFGENYAQEALEKASAIPQAEWHLIGALQTNKAKSVAGRFALIHSVDREKLALELAKAAGAKGLVQDILLQVRVGGEETKSGVELEGAPALIERILGLSALRLRGIMALPPLTESESVARARFRSLRQAFESWRKTLLTPDQARAFTELSMGTSSDFEWAILEGATYVRVGTSIFGAREYKV